MSEDAPDAPPTESEEETLTPEEVAAVIAQKKSLREQQARVEAAGKEVAEVLAKHRVKFVNLGIQLVAE